jgi:hypothetical protein
MKERKQSNLINAVNIKNASVPPEDFFASSKINTSGIFPNYLQDIFINTQEVHNHNTRHREFNYTLPMPNTNAMKKSLSYRGAETWNALPIDLKSLGSVATFKSGVKQCRLI